jgi:hypothetical protein
MATKKVKPKHSILNQKINKQPITHLDLTPNADMVVRILKVYRENCNVEFVTNDDRPMNPLFVEMNKAQKERAKLLDEAIAKLGG